MNHWLWKSTGPASLLVALSLVASTDVLSAAPPATHQRTSPPVPTSRTAAEYREQRAQVLTFIRDGKAYLELGEFKKAEAKFRAALKLDPNSDAAHHYLHLASRKDRRPARLKATPYYHTNSGLPFLTYSSKGAERIRKKMREIVIPKVHFDGVTLDRVVSQLIEMIKANDPERDGVNFLINSPAADLREARPDDGKKDPASKAAQPAPVLDAFGNPPPPPAASRVDLPQTKIRIHHPLFDLKLEQVLDAIVKTAEQPITFLVEEYAIVFTSRAGDAAPFFTRIFKTNPEKFRTALNLPNLKPSAAHGGGSRGVTADVDQTKTNEIMRQVLAQAGVRNLGTNAGSHATQVFYNRVNGYLLVRATLQDLDIVQQWVDRVNALRIRLEVHHARLPRDQKLTELIKDAQRPITAKQKEAMFAAVRSATGGRPEGKRFVTRSGQSQSLQLLGRGTAGRRPVNLDLRPFTAKFDTAVFIDGTMRLGKTGKPIDINVELDAGQTAVLELPTVDGQAAHLLFIAAEIVEDK